MSYQSLNISSSSNTIVKILCHTVTLFRHAGLYVDRVVNLGTASKYAYYWAFLLMSEAGLNQLHARRENFLLGSEIQNDVGPSFSLKSSSVFSDL